MYLTGNSKTGEKITKNWTRFKYEYKAVEELGDKLMYKFEWTFDGQHGFISIILRKKDNNMSNSSLINTDNDSIHQFARPLGLYNDRSLEPLFRNVMLSIGINVSGVYSE